LSLTTTTHKPRIPASQFEAWRSGIAEQRRAADAFQNIAANLGFQSSNLLEATQYPLTRLTFNYILLQSLYRSHWIIRKIIDSPAEDMTKNWVSLDSDLAPEQLKRFEQACKLTGTANQVLTTLKWARLFGGAAAIIVIKGDENRLDKPLKVEDVEPDSYRGLIPLDRWAGITPGATLCSDIDRPLDFGLPTNYQVTLKTGRTFTIDASRVVRFIGRDVPSWEKEVEQQWGVSEVEIVFDELRKRDNTSWNIASLVFRANIVGLRQDNLAQMLSGLNANPQVQRNFYATIAAQASLMSNQGLLVLPEKGALETHPYAFGGVGLMYQQFKEDMAGAAEIPYSRIFGRPPGGLATTNEGDEHVYYERIRARQQRDLDPQMMKLFPVIAMSTWGSVPDDFDWNWRPVATLSTSEQATIGQVRTQAILEAYNAGVISPRTTLQEFQQMSEETELWTNVTDKDVAAADDKTISPVEAMEMQQEQAEQSAEQEAEAKGKEAENPAPVLKVEAKPEKKPAKKAAAKDAALDRYMSHVGIR
jgi:phage-related protein (TIGR01555 family)